MAKFVVNNKEVSIELEKIKKYEMMKKSNSHIVLKKCGGPENKELCFYYTDKEIWYNGKQYSYDKNLRNRKKKQGDNDHDLFSPMPGKIIKLNVKVSQEVVIGQTLLILEAMKMEHAVKSPIDGVVEEIFFKQGELVDSDVELIRLASSKTKEKN